MASELLSRTNFEITIISDDGVQFPEMHEFVTQNANRIHIIHGLDNKSNFFRNTIKIFRLAQKRDFDILHCQTNNQFLISILSHIILGTKLAYTIHAFSNSKSTFRRVITSRIQSLFLRKFAAKVFSISSFVDSNFRGLGVEKCVKLYHGLDIPPQVSHCHSDHYSILYLANFLPGKRHEFLIQEISPFLSSHAHAKLHLLGDGPLRSRIISLKDELGIGSQVIIHGWVDRNTVESFLRNTDTAVVASKSETFGYCIAEPLTFGIPVISTPTGISVDVIVQGKNGFILPENEKQQGAELRKHLEYLAKNPEARIQMGINAYTAAMVFRWENVIKIYEQEMRKSAAATKNA